MPNKVDNYTDVLKVLREPGKGPGRKLWQRPRFKMALLACVISFAVLMCIPSCRALALLVLGDSSLAMEDQNDAVRLYGWALLSQPDNLTAMDKYGNSLVAVGRESDAAKVFEDKLKLDGGRLSTVFQLAQIDLKLKNYTQALQYAERWIQLSPDSSLAFRCRGRALEGLQRFELAVADYDRSIKLDPRSESVVDKEQCLDKLRHEHHNFELLTEPTYENDPSDYYAVLRDGVRQFLALEQLQSFKTFDRAIQLRPRDPLAFYLKARCEYAMHRFAQARSDYIMVGKLWNGKVPLQLPVATKGSLLPQSGRASPQGRYYFEFGMACYHAGDYRGALAAFNQADKSDIGKAKLYFYRWHTYEALGQTAKAEQDRRRYYKCGLPKNQHSGSDPLNIW